MLIQEHVNKRGLRQRWYDNKDEANLVLESVPFIHRGEFTPVFSLPNNNTCPTTWRVDDYPPRDFSTYRMSCERNQPFIECKECGVRSFHPTDIEQKYCSNCHRFHEEA